MKQRWIMGIIGMLAISSSAMADGPMCYPYESCRGATPSQLVGTVQQHGGYVYSGVEMMFPPPSPMGYYGPAATPITYSVMGGITGALQGFARGRIYEGKSMPDTFYDYNRYIYPGAGVDMLMLTR